MPAAQSARPADSPGRSGGSWKAQDPAQRRNWCCAAKEDAMTTPRHCRSNRGSLRRPLWGTLLAMLAACGGGGGSDGSTPPPVNQAPIASFAASPLSGVVPLSVSFDASSSSDTDGSITTYAWTFGDGTDATGRTVSHTYTTAGTYSAGLTVTDDDGATASASRDISVTTTPPVNQPPSASFSATPLYGVVPLLVSFDASASSDTDGSITDYAWNFGDGTSGAGRIVSHTYAMAGTYSAQLTITDDDSAAASASRDISVTTTLPVNQPPVPSFTASPLSGDAPLLVNFDASASSDTDGSITAYAWNFGDGTVGTGRAVSHTYATVGTYTARLTVTDDDGAIASATSSLSVTTPSANQPPVALFTASPLSGTAPLLVSFDASAASDADGSITAYAWDFGDGTTGTGRTVSHTYATVGTYTSRLTVTDDDGATSSKTVSIDVLSSNAQWLGRYESSLITDAPLYAELVLTGSTLSGSLTDGAGRTGTLNGSVAGTTVTLTITETTQNCSGTFAGTGTLGTVAGLESVDFVFTGSDCLGAHTSGKGLLIRQTGLVLAWGQNEPTSLVHDNGELFWTDSSPEPLKKFNLASGKTEVLATRMRALTRMTVEPSRLLWIDAIGDSNAYCTGVGVQQALMVAAIDGSGVRKLAEGPACGGTVAPVSDGTYAYWVTSRTGTGAWRIDRIPLAGGAAWEVRTADGFTSITSLATDNTHLYWIEDNAPDYGYVRRCSLDACGYTMQTPFTGIYIDMATNLVLTGDQIVFGARRYATPSDRIITVPKTGSAGTDIAIAPDFPTAVVTDGTTCSRAQRAACGWRDDHARDRPAAVRRLDGRQHACGVDRAAGQHRVQWFDPCRVEIGRNDRDVDCERRLAARRRVDRRQRPDLRGWRDRLPACERQRYLSALGRRQHHDSGCRHRGSRADCRGRRGCLRFGGLVDQARAADWRRGQPRVAGEFLRHVPRYRQHQRLLGRGRSRHRAKGTARRRRLHAARFRQWPAIRSACEWHVGLLAARTRPPDESADGGRCRRDCGGITAGRRGSDRGC
jgi:PKD repeat protein